MLLTTNTILYYMHNSSPQFIGNPVCSTKVRGVKHLVKNTDSLCEEYIYVSNVTQILKSKANFEENMVLFLIANDKYMTTAKEDFLKSLPCSVVLFHNDLTENELINQLIDTFYFLTEWDKTMHISILEGKSPQHLLSISEHLLKYPAIVFDGTFNVIAYTQNTPSEYPSFCETVERGYTSANIINQLKKKDFFYEISHNDLSIAPAANDDGRVNIYIQFFSEKSSLGSLCIFHEKKIPEQGYLDWLHYFMNIFSMCMKKHYYDQRYVKMMYETVLINLLNDSTFSEEQLSEQIELIDNLEVKGTFTLAVLTFKNNDDLLLQFYNHNLSRQCAGILVFIYKNSICLLKASKSPNTCNDRFFSKDQEKRIAAILDEQDYHFGISNTFSHISEIKGAYIQAMTALNYAQDANSNHLYYNDYSYWHLFSSIEKELPISQLRSNLYMEILNYDKAHNTKYLRLLISYIKNDCSVSITAADLGMHRNSIHNALNFIQDRFKISFASWATKKELILSSEIDNYLEKNNCAKCTIIQK